MKVVRALYYQYYWWQMRREKDAFLIPLLSVMSVLIPLFGIIGFIAIFADVIGLIVLRNYDMKMVISVMFILGFTVMWWMFLRKKQYKIIVQEHDIYDNHIYRTLAVLYPVLSAILFFIGLYVGYIHNS